MRGLLLAAGLAWQALSPEAIEHVKAGVAAQKQGQLAVAITEFKKVTELAPELPAAFVNLGAAYLESHDYADAIPPLKRSVELNPELVGAQQMLGYALLSQGYAAEAIPHLERAGAVDSLGIAQLKTGQLSEAVVNLQAALSKRPNDPELLFYLGRASGLLSKNAFDTLEAAYPDSASSHLALGENYAALRQNRQAEQEYLAALQIKPDMQGIHLALGELYTRDAAWPKAEAEFRDEGKLQPGNAEIAYDLGQTLLEQGKIEASRAELERADRLRPGMPETLYLLGKTAGLQGDSAAAEKAWRQVITIEKNTPLAAQAHFGLATLYRKQGKTAQAEAEMQDFHRLKPSPSAQH